jgi:hypothetical protein
MTHPAFTILIAFLVILLLYSAESKEKDIRELNLRVVALEKKVDVLEKVK